MEDAMRTTIPLTVLATALACSLATAPAHARARVFVASYGNDSNPCTFLSPCRNFQQAVNVVDAGGEVTAIDSAGFGPITINDSVTITSPPGIEAGVVPTAGGNAVTINPSTAATITLRGLTLQGSGVGLNGIVLAATAPGTLNIIDCVVDSFTGTGILITPSSGGSHTLLIANSYAMNNGANGIEIDPLAASIIAYTIDQTTVTNNGASGTNAGILINAGAGFSNGTLSSVNASRNFIGVNVIGNNINNVAYIRNSIMTISSSGNDFSDTSTNGAVVFLFDSNQIGNLTNGGLINSDGTNDIISSFGGPIIPFTRK
jgi:hypothetical protein